MYTKHKTQNLASRANFLLPFLALALLFSCQTLPDVQTDLTKNQLRDILKVDETFNRLVEGHFLNSVRLTEMVVSKNQNLSDFRDIAIDVLSGHPESFQLREFEKIEDVNYGMIK